MNQYTRLDPRYEAQLRRELLRAELWANGAVAPPRSRRSGQAPSGLVASRFDRLSLAVAGFAALYFVAQLVRGAL